ncbi:MAG: GTPase ObgE [Anaerolineae bacterium]
METSGFIDEARIHVRGGDGGNGVVAFRREKYVPRGGPAGGDGGDGGDVILEADAQMNTLFSLHQQTHFTAGHGAHGRGKNQTGARGHDVVIRVPVGTVVYDAESGAVLADLATPGQRVVVARGGRGGRGNARFATSTHQAPRIAEKGEPGERRWLRLELKLLADVGLIGMPNAGKSTLLSAVSAAKPKIADYPFTTLQPNLGVVSVNGEYEFVLADLPGLIEGAHTGAGLGHQFLRHVERTRLLIHVLDGSQPDVLDHYARINEELRLYNPILVERPQVIAFNKMDLPEAQARWPEAERFLSKKGKVFPISAATGQGVQQLMRCAGQMLQTLPPPPPMSGEVPIFRLDEAPEFTVKREGNIWLVEGKRIEQLVARTMWQYPDAAERAQRQMEAMGVLEALRRAGVQPGDTVRIGNMDLEWLW